MAKQKTSSQEKNLIRLVITGGHHTSALPVITEFEKSHPEVKIFWVGHKHSLKGDKNETLEYKDITKRGLPFFDLQAGKIYKTYDLSRLIKVPWGFIQALIYLLKVRPHAILSFGGYLAAPVVLAGWILGIPSVTHEQTVVAGYANKFISYFVKKIFISWPDSARYFPANKIVQTGIPLRPEIYKITTNNFVFDNNLPVIYITAGKTGSHKINSIVFENLKDLLLFCNVIHQTGDHSELKDYERLSAKYSRLKNKIKNSNNEDSRVGRYFPKKFIFENEIGEAFNKASLVVSRSGAHASGEILALKKPALLIPIPWVSHNEQMENALMLKDSGLAEILEEKDLTSKKLIETIKKMLEKLPNYKGKKETHGLFVKNSAKIICDEVLSIALKS